MQLLHRAGASACGREVFDPVWSVGAHFGDLPDQRCGLLELPDDVHVAFGFDRCSEQVAHDIDRRANRHGGAHGIAECRRGHDLTRPDIVGNQIHDRLTRTSRIRVQFGAAGTDRRVAGQCHTECFGHAVH